MDKMANKFLEDSTLKIIYSKFPTHVFYFSVRMMYKTTFFHSKSLPRHL